MNYKQIYFNLIKKALQRESVDGYYETHHIIPRCLGGTDDKNNLVKLTAREHFVAHYLLVKIRPDNNGLKCAIWRMCNGNSPKGNHRIPSRTYEWMRKSFSESMSKIMKHPSHNASFGTCWIYNEEQKETKKINRNDLQTFVEQGWKKGRVFDFNKLKYCKCCKEDFISKYNKRKQKYCSHNCSNIAKRNRSELKSIAPVPT
jgi:hypothetical protein